MAPSVVRQKQVPPGSEVPPARHGWQFQLRHLFGLTTIAAICAALIAAYGPGTLVTAAGLLLAWLNQTGAFEPLQNGRRQTVLIWLACATFLVSLALPSIRVFGPVLGFWAAWFVLVGPANALMEGRDIDPRGLVLFLMIDVANILIAILPVVLRLLPPRYSHRLSLALCIAMVAPWCIGWTDRMLVGYYIWCGSFFVALIAIPIGTRMLMTMVFAAVATGLLARWTH